MVLTIFIEVNVSQFNFESHFLYRYIQKKSNEYLHHPPLLPRQKDTVHWMHIDIYVVML